MRDPSPAHFNLKSHVCTHCAGRGYLGNPCHFESPTWMYSCLAYFGSPHSHGFPSWRCANKQIWCRIWRRYKGLENNENFIPSTTPPLSTANVMCGMPTLSGVVYDKRGQATFLHLPSSVFLSVVLLTPVRVLNICVFATPRTHGGSVSVHLRH